MRWTLPRMAASTGNPRRLSPARHDIRPGATGDFGSGFVEDDPKRGGVWRFGGGGGERPLVRGRRPAIAGSRRHRAMFETDRTVDPAGQAAGTGDQAANAPGLRGLTGAELTR